MQMKLKYGLISLFKIFFNLSLSFLLVSLIFINKSINSLEMPSNLNSEIVEELRIKVPKKYKKEWLKAEKEVWDKWLETKDGFLGRQIYWDEKRSQGLLLVTWESKQKWKKISEDEVLKIQKQFEGKVKEFLDMSSNPFDLIYEGELFKEK